MNTRPSLRLVYSSAAPASPARPRPLGTAEASKAEQKLGLLRLQWPSAAQTVDVLIDAYWKRLKSGGAA